MKTRKRHNTPFRMLKTALLSWTLVLGMIFVVYANVSGSLTDTGIGLDSSGDGAWNASGTEVNITIAGESGNGCGGSGSSKSATLTISNNKESLAMLSFNWTATNVNSLTIDGSTCSESSGSFSKLLEAGESIEVKITTGENDTQNILNLKDLALVVATASSNVTINYDSALGSVTAGGNAVADGAVVEGVTLEAGIELVATASNGSTFLGWVDAADGMRLSTAATYTLTPVENMTVRPAFAKSGTNLWFLVNQNKMFDDFNAAHNAAGSGGIVVPMHDGTLPAGDYTIPANVTLLIPYDAANTVRTTSPATSDATNLTKPTAYRTLTMDSGANIVVNGAISIGGTVHSAMAKGTPFGPVGFINMASGSNITINNGAKLYAWGYITGSGSVTVESGGEVYESFQISDWRGGSATNAMVGNDEKIFPMTQYYVQNIEVPMTLKAGAKETGFMSVAVSYVGIQETTVPFIGSDEGMFRISGGSITKDYDEARDRMVIDLTNAQMTIAPITISIRAAALASVTIKSEEYVLPVTTNLTLNINSGSSVGLSQDIAFLPGAEVNIASGATCTVSGDSSIYVYDVDDWGNYCGAGNAKLTTIAYAPGKKVTRTADGLVDAAIKVNGTVDASAGYIYTTSGGANIYSDGEGKIIQRVGSETVTYQATYVKDGYTPNSIPITPAQLKNANGEYVKTADYGSGTYKYVSGVWRPECVTWHKADGNKIMYNTIAEAVAAYESNNGYLQMRFDTNETEEVLGAGKTINLDLNGKNVTVGTLTGTININGMDSTTDAFGRDVPANETYVPGTLMVENMENLNVKPLYSHSRGSDLYRHYVAVNDEGVYSFHRFRFGIQQYTYYSKQDTMIAVTIGSAYIGDDAALGEMDALGMMVNETPGWNSNKDTWDSTTIENGYYLCYTITKSPETEKEEYSIDAMLDINGKQIVNESESETATVTVTLGG